MSLPKILIKNISLILENRLFSENLKGEALKLLKCTIFNFWRKKIFGIFNLFQILLSLCCFLSLFQINFLFFI